MQSRYKKNNKESVEKSVVFKNILNYFGLCKPEQENEKIFRTSTIPNDPASQMEMRLSKKQNRVSATSNKTNSRYALGNKPYSHNQVFVLGHQHKIIAKITSKTIRDYHSKVYQSQNASPMMKSREAPNISPLLRPRVPSDLQLKEEFSLDLNKEVVCAEQENPKLSNSNIARYLAHRLKCDVLIDAIGGIGYNLRQFSKYCNQVVAFEANEKRIQTVQKQLENYPETQNIDFIMADFRKIGKLLWSDIVFIDSDHCEDLSLDFLDSELSSLLAKSLQVSHSVALKLPADIEIDELPHLFNKIVDDHDIYAKRFCIEIEKVMNEEDEVECTVVYFGNCAKVEIQEECEAIYDYLLAFEEEGGEEEGIENPKKVLRHPFPMARTLFEKVGIQKVLKLICEVEDDLAFTNMSFSLYELFLEKIIYQRIYTKENLEKTIEEESYKAKSNLSILNSGNTLYYTTTTTKLTENKVQKPEENKDNFPETMQNTLALDSGPDLTKNGTFDSLPKFKAQHKNTEDYSELSISSYAVSSDFFDEDPDDTLMDSKVSGRSSHIHEILKLQSRELIDNPLEAIENKQRAVSNNFGGLRTSSSPKKNIVRGQTPLDLLNSQKFSSTSKDNSEFTISGMDHNH